MVVRERDAELDRFRNYSLEAPAVRNRLILHELENPPDDFTLGQALMNRVGYAIWNQNMDLFVSVREYYRKVLNAGVPKEEIPFAARSLRLSKIVPVAVFKQRVTIEGKRLLRWRFYTLGYYLERDKAKYRVVK